MTSGPSRRRFLWLGLSASLAAAGLGAGCSVDDPRIEAPRSSAEPEAAPNGSPPARSAPSPTPTFAGAAAGAEAEQELAGLAAAVLSGPWRNRLGARRPLIARIQAAHLEHAAALFGPQPTTRATDTAAKPIAPAAPSKSLESAMKKLAKAEGTQAARHRTAALATTGYSALLWGSMSVAASSYAAAVTSTRPVPARKPVAHRPMPQLSDVESMQLLVRQLHAIIYGYQLAIGQLSDGGRRDSAFGRLREHRILLDWLTTALVARSAQVPAAEPAYVPSVSPRSDATAAQLILSMEIALAPFCGLWLAAANNPERTRAFSTLSGTVTTARRLGAPISAWPGWSP